jgi:hypothetical protein
MQPLHDIWVGVRDAMVSWHQGKLFVEHVVTINHDALHIIVGTLVWLLFAMLLRRPITSWYPWLWTLAVIMWNEAVDLWTEHWPEPGQQYGEGAKDLLLTMLIPTILALSVRFVPGLIRAPPTRRR